MFLKISKFIFPTTVKRFSLQSRDLSFVKLNPLMINLRFGSPYIHRYFSTSRNNLLDSDQTFQLLIKRLEQCVEHSSELEKQLSDDTTSYDKKINKQQIRKEISQLAPIYTLHQKIQGHRQNIKDLNELIAQTKDKEEKELLNEQIQASKQQLDELKSQCWELLVPPSPFDHADDIILQFRPGAGGSQSCIFVQDLSEMYQSYCAHQGWRCTVSNSVKQAGVSRGYKVLDLRVQGQGAHKILKCEAGVHKVIRIPETESKGRIHSSTISMIVMPVVPFTFNLDLKDIKYQFTRSSGPGGQAVNKIESACRATHIPTGLQVFIQQERSQQANKKRATEILKQKIFEIQYRKANEQQQSKRKSQVTTMDRSEKIRTYNYPQDRITDHRTGLTKFGISSMMNGNLLQEFIGSYIESVTKEKIEALIEDLYAQAGIALPKK